MVLVRDRGLGLNLRRCIIAVHGGATRHRSVGDFGQR